MKKFWYLAFAFLFGCAQIQKAVKNPVVVQLAKEVVKDVVVAKLPALKQIEIHRYIVKPGDTLWSISKSLYGNAFLWPLLTHFNNLADPNVLVPGQILKYMTKDQPIFGNEVAIKAILTEAYLTPAYVRQRKNG